jgi:predicted Zn-dependent protease
MIRVYKDKLKTDMMSAATGRDLNSIRIFDLISTLSFSRENELEADTV